ncbi:hypothetical protein V8J88_09030 [Massilia sp. W12]|uniref:hypothetical protein n=1 Tax=Massilia sp. W12 TaxID=3126507 RepID=UPI0030D37050
MGLKLFNFTYQTLMSQSNDQNSSMFLPKVLSNMQNNGSAWLPLIVNNWSTKNVQGMGGVAMGFANTWFNGYMNYLYTVSADKPNPPALTQQMIDDATALLNTITSNNLGVLICDNCGPDINITELEIDGLANVRISGAPPQVTQSDQDYRCTITLEFNAYKSDGAPWNQPLTVSGNQTAQDSKTNASFKGFRFQASQCLNFVDASNQPISLPKGVDYPPSTCNPLGFDDLSSGVMQLGIAQAELLADVSIGVANGNLSLTLHSLSLQKPGGGDPVYSLNNLSIDSNQYTQPFVSVWTQFLQGAIQTPDMQKQLTGNFNQSLNSADNLSQVQKTLQEQLNNAINKVMGSTALASGGGDDDSNAVDIYLYNRMRGAVNDANSYLYVPVLVLGNTSPQLEPWNPGPITIPGTLAQQTVQGIPVSMNDLSMSNLSATGLSNLLAPAAGISFSAAQSNTSFLLGRLNPGPTLTVKGQRMTVPNPPFTLVSPFTVSVSVNHSPNPIAVGGTLTLMLQPADSNSPLGVSTVQSASGDTASNLEITFSSIVLAANPADISVQITLTQGQAFDPFVNGLLNSDDSKKHLLAALNTYLSQNLAQISASATQFARQALANMGQ